MASAAAPMAAAAPPGDATRTDALGRFTLLAPLGAGGMGAVYLARDPERGEVALKMLHASTPEARLRFRREFRAARRLEHPRIVRVYEMGHDDGQDWYTMEYVRGVGLGRCVRERGAGLSALDRTKRVLDLAAQVAEGLAYLHAQSVVHRDLKPENVLVDDAWNAKLLDFGLARELEREAGDADDERGPESATLTQAGTVLGTALYMAPEQAKGLPIDARADLYALGCILYELVAGVPPFAGGTIHAVLYRHIYEAPARLDRLVPAAPPALVAVVHDLLAKDPADRPATAGLVEARLRAIAPATSEAAFAATLSLPAAALVVRAPRLVGRDLARARIGAAVDAAVRKQGGVVHCTGPRACGKSRLLDELRGEAALRPVSVHAVRAADLSPRPFGAASILVDSVVAEMSAGGGPPSASVAAAARVLAPACPAAGALAGEGPAGATPDGPREGGVSSDGGAPGAGAVGGQGPERLAAAAAELVRAAAQSRPVVWIVDDAQALDDASAAAVEAVARLAADAPVLVAVGGRPPEPGHDDARATRLVEWVNANARAVALPCPALERGEVIELLRSMLGAEPPPALVDRLCAGGAWPGDVVEIVHALHARGTLRASGPRWDLVSEPAVAPDAGTSVPRVVAELWTERLAALDEDAREVAAYAAILEHDLAFDTLAAVTGLPEDALLDALNRLLGAGLLRVLATVGGSVERYAFADHRASSVVRERLSAARRTALHRRVAESLELRHRDDPKEVAMDLARHFERAGDGARAAHFHVLSAEVAAARYAHREAARHLASVQALRAEGHRAPLDDDELALRKAHEHVAAGEGAAAIAETAGIVAAADRGGAGASTPLARARARYYHARGLVLTGRYGDAMPAYEASLREIGERVPARPLGMLLDILWSMVLWLLAITGLRCKSLKAEERVALAVYRDLPVLHFFVSVPNQVLWFGVAEGRFERLAARKGSPELLAEMHFRHANALQILFGPGGHHFDAHRARGDEYARRMGDLALMAKVESFGAHLKMGEGHLPEAAAMVERSLALSERGGDPAMALLTACVGLDVAILRGDVAEGERMVARARELLRRVSDPMIEGIVLQAETLLALRRGAIDEAEASLARPPSERHAMYEGFEQRFLAEVALARGQLDLALRYAQAAVDAHRGFKFGWLYHAAQHRTVVSVALARLAERPDDAERRRAARRALGGYHRYARRNLVGAALVARQRAEYALLCGRPEQARRLCERAVAYATRAGTRLELAATSLVLARVQRAMGEPAAAAATEIEAHAAYDALGVARHYRG